MFWQIFLLKFGFKLIASEASKKEVMQRLHPHPRGSASGYFTQVYSNNRLANDLNLQPILKLCLFTCYAIECFCYII